MHAFKDFLVIFFPALIFYFTCSLVVHALVPSVVLAFYLSEEFLSSYSCH
jgi:hypothetical protein